MLDPADARVREALERRKLDAGAIAEEAAKLLTLLTGRPYTLDPEEWLRWWNERSG